jgi:L-asparaginase II
MLESLHHGHAVVCDHTSGIVQAWGQADLTIFPRSTCKILQALPLVESGAAKAAGLKSEHLALACASHHGALMHTERVEKWLAHIGKGESDLRCGNQSPNDAVDRFRLHDAGLKPCQIHNNCSGKHTGFLTLSAHLKAGPEYVDVTHPVQLAARQAFEEMTGEDSPGFGIDGCSAPNFATSLAGLARAMAKLARPTGLGVVREAASETLVQAMIAHPLLLSGEGNACAEMMAAMDGVAVKNGAEGVQVAILPKLGLGVALKIEDGASRAAEVAMAAILVRLGVLDAASATAQKYTKGPILNRRGLNTGLMKSVVH